MKKNNHIRALDTIPEMFQIEKGNKTSSQHYVNFNRAYEEKVLFLISYNVKKMQKQWDQQIVLAFF